MTYNNTSDFQLKVPIKSKQVSKNQTERVPILQRK